MNSKKAYTRAAVFIEKLIMNMDFQEIEEMRKDHLNRIKEEGEKNHVIFFDLIYTIAAYFAKRLEDFLNENDGIIEDLTDTGFIDNDSLTWKF